MDVQEGYNYDIERIRATEFPNLKDVTYVDHAGSTLYAQSQLDAYHKDLCTNLYGNPHSRSQSSRLATDTIDQVRYRILQFFGASAREYSVIFTSGCTGALKLIAETFTFHDRDPETEGHRSRTIQDCGSLVYLQDNHTSVQGMRELVCDRTSGIYCLDEHELHQNISEQWNQISKASIKNETKDETKELSNCNLFVYPAQSNFSGRKYPMSWISDVHERRMKFQTTCPGKWFVLLDAASYVSTSMLDLQKYKPDFVSVSFYKIFGLPTGLGALIVRNEASPQLQKRYFGGGTVAVSNARERFHVFRSTITDRFEDGTVSFLDIIALRHGLDALQRLGGGMNRVSQHAFAVARYFHDNLRSLHHASGLSLAEIYCDSFDDVTTQGAIVTFNIRRDDGQFVGFAEVDKLAQLHDIHLRTGCFCNIGACQKHLNLTSQQIRDNFDAGHVCGDDRDMIDGRPTGAIRISFGYMSTFHDARQCLKMLAACFIQGSPVPEFQITQQTKPEKCQMLTPPTTSVCVQEEIHSVSHIQEETHPSPHGVRSDRTESADEAILSTLEQEVLDKCCDSSRYLLKICLYPIKSCAAFEVAQWDIGPRGLLYDRQWMIVSESGVTLGQKREPKLCLLRPKIDLVCNTLTLYFPEMPPLVLSLSASDGGDTEASMCTNKVCGDRVDMMDCGDLVSDWLSEAVGRSGTRLVRQKQEDVRVSKLKDAATHATSDGSKLSLVNESQFLLVSRESVASLHKKMTDQEHGTKSDEQTLSVDVNNLVDRFRGNLIVGGGSSFEEDDWSHVTVGDLALTSQGQCSRCGMVCLDQNTGEKSREPLKTLVAWRGKKVPFGVYMRQMTVATDSECRTLHVGDQVFPQHKQQT